MLRPKNEVEKRLQTLKDAPDLAKEMHDTSNYLKLRAEIKQIKWVLE